MMGMSYPPPDSKHCRLARYSNNLHRNYIGDNILELYFYLLIQESVDLFYKFLNTYNMI